MVDKISWLGSPEARIINIRKFRQYINTLPFKKAIVETKKNWDAGPRINNSSFHISNIDSWPTPWDLFSQSFFSIEDQTLGIFYTLLLSDHAKMHSIKLAIAEDIIQGEKPVIVIDNYPLTNYNISAIITENTIKNKLGE